jgi:cell division protein FtsL
MRALALEPTARLALRSRRPSISVLGLAVAAWFGLCLAAGAWVQLETIQTGYRISAQRRERTGLLEDRRKLQLELARLSALDRIEAIATGKLGMRYPSAEEVVKLP